MIELSMEAWEASANLPKNPKTPDQKHLANTIKFIKSFLSKWAIPSAFVLHCENGVQAAGTIKDLALEEPISTHYFKHGISGLADVYLVGIKEIPSSTLAIPDNDMLGLARQAAQVFSEMIFDPKAIRVTPIALFRKL
jgi:hypothetical protein